MDRVKIANTLRVLRGDKKREEVALACEVSANAISMYENGARIPADDVKIKLASYYGKTVQELFYS